MTIKMPKFPEEIFGAPTDIMILWLRPFFLIVVVLMSILGVIVPKIGEIQGKIDKVKTVTKQKELVDQKRNYLLSVDQEEIKNNSDLLAAGVLPEKSSYVLVKVVRNAAAEAGFSVDEFTVSMGDIKQDASSKPNNLNYDRIPVQVTVSGPSSNYLSLVKVIEKSLPLMSIDNYEMTTSEGVAKIKLAISAYYLRDISNLKLDNLSLADLTLSKQESDLLSTIREFKPMAVEKTYSSEGEFIKYQRTDPFFTL